MMKETKTCFRFFSIMDYEKEADFLRKMHKKGWKFVKVSLGGFYGFEACEPEDVVYQLDYNPDGVKHQNEYLQMFKDCGWEYMQDFVGYSYFRKPVSEMDGDESIFCDDESRLDMATRVVRGKVIPLLVGFCCCIVPQFLMNTIHYNRGEDAVQNMLAILLGAVFVLYLVVFIQFGIKYYQFKKKIGR